ncbi:MAG: GNAT family N-acetyltransferase [Oscillospiraceae bacterium]|nr:GNAT family N-acetyltransferase [Oscillospiraceae bacterium]
MKTVIKKVTSGERDILANLLEKYNYEFSQYDKRKFDNNGLFGYKYLNNYFSEEGRFAYFIYVDDLLAGFALINKYKECSRPIDWSMAEFFVSYNFRRQGVGAEAVRQIFEKHKGLWHIKYHKNNMASVVLWNKTAKKYDENFELCIGDEPFNDGTEARVLFFEVK